MKIFVTEICQPFANIHYRNLVMKTGNVYKKILPARTYFILRDFYASLNDVSKYLKVRSEYTNFSFLKNLLVVFKTLALPKKTILCYPDRPSYYHVIYKLSAICGYKISTNPFKQCKPVFWSHNVTFPDRSEIKILADKKGKIINSNCTNLSKQKVGMIFKKVFGYTLDVDPTQYDGVVEEKSIYNGTNYATTLNAPISENRVRDGYVYQKLIESRSLQDQFIMVYRLPVYADEIPVIYVKYRPEKTRFTGHYEKVDVKKPAEIFSDDELQKILKMNRRMGIDYGECDVMRDCDGKIYVVDINSNPGGPPDKMSHDQKVRSAKILIPTFKKMMDRFID